VHICLQLVAATLMALGVAVPGLGCEGLKPGPTGTVSAVVDGDTVLLDTGLAVRLVGIQAPRLGKGRPGVPDWPLGEESRSALSGLVLGKPVRLAYGGAERDRYGRALAQVFIDAPGADAPDGPPSWVQRAMLAAGMARVYSFPDNRACVDELLASERQARADRLGLWADPFYAVRQAEKPASLAGLTGRFELVEGRIVSTGTAGRRLYLDFGRRWKDDFTAIIDAAALRRFAKAGMDPAGLAGALVRVRGWIEERSGPLVEVTHPEQIEVLSRP
jgi:endonuclease YncB( thermonuclease family)